MLPRAVAIAGDEDGELFFKGLGPVRGACDQIAFGQDKKSNTDRPGCFCLLQKAHLQWYKISNLINFHYLDRGRILSFLSTMIVSSY